KKGYDMRGDAIPIKAAKASRDIASDYKYKAGYRKQVVYKSDLGWLKGLGWVPIGSPEVEKAKTAASILSEKLYRQHPSKFKFTSTTQDMEMVLAKTNKDIGNKRLYTEAWESDKKKVHMMPDTLEVNLARQNKINYSVKQYKLANEEAKKKGYDMRGDPSAAQLRGSQDEVMCSFCVLSQNVYKADLKWLQGLGWVPIGSFDVEKAKNAAAVLSERKYRQHPSAFQFTTPSDAMPIARARNNAQTMNQRLYTEAWEKDKKIIHIMPDTPEIILAQQNKLTNSRKYYRQGFEDTIRKGYFLPSDAVSVKAAKASRDIASDYKYKQGYRKQVGHHIGALSIQDDPLIMLALNSARIASDALYKKDFEKSKTKFHLPNVYKADMEFMRGLGWVPIGSLDVVKAKKAAEILNDRLYRQKPDSFRFTQDMQSMPMVLAKTNAQTINKRLYNEAWEKEKLKVHVPPDTPEILLSRANAANLSKKLYRQGFEEAIRKGHDIKPDAVSIRAAKASRDIASDYKYKAGYRKQVGHHIGALSIKDDPLLMLALNSARIASDALYKKDFEKSKTKFNLPAIYKADMEWIRGTGWVPIGSLDVEKAKKAAEILSERKYRQHPSKFKFTSKTDAMPIVLAQTNAKIMDQRAYTDAWNKEKIHIHIMPDTPEITLAQQNRLNTSLKHYKQGYEDAIRKGYYLPKDAISVLSARASRDIISDYKYKTGYRKQLGHHIGARCVQDDPLIMKAFNAAKISSDLVYKKDFEKSKTKFHLPVDMLMIEMAKKCQIQVNDFNYRTYLHNWTCLPDSNDVVQARKVYDLRSDAVYKADLEWLRGCGWMPQGSLDVIKVKKAQTILNDRLYRQPPSTVKFTSVVDLPAVVLAKQNAETISDRKYKEAWEKDKTSIHIMPDTPAIELSKANAINISNRLYTKAWDASKAKGYHIKQDAISVLKAKASRDIASDYKYKAGYRKQVGHHIGALSIVYKSDLEWLKGVGWIPHESMEVVKVRNAQKIVSDRGYRVKLDEQKFTAPLDRMDLVCAKNAADVLNDAKYRQAWHRDKVKYTMLDTPLLVTAREAAKNINSKLYAQAWDKIKATSYFMPPDAVSIKQCIHTSRMKSDYNYKAGYRKQVGHHIGALSIVYKSDLEWIRGCGWIAADSVDHVKVRKAQQILNDRIYKKNAVENFAKYTHIVDRPEILLAKVNAANLSDLKYKESFNLEKGKYIGSEDTPQLAHSREMAKNISEKLYKSSWDTTKATSYQLNEKYLPLVGAKHSRDTASMVKYKDAHEKAKGHYMASIGADFPEVVRAAVVEKMKGLREYHKAYESTKTKLHIPVDMISTVVAKKCQEILSDVLYRTYLHQWTCHPDQSDAIQARKANEILSDVFYKDDLNWMKGIGCYVWDTPEIVRAKKSYELQSDMKYRAEGKKNFSNYSIVTDTPVYVTAVQGHTWASDLIYKEAYNKEKHLYTTILDTFDYTRCSNLKDLFSNRLYKEAWEKIKASSYKVPVDSNALVHAKEQKAILSKVKYRENYEKTKHAYTLPKCLEDDPQAARCVKVGKLNLDRLYKSNYEQNKAKVHLPPDMLDVVAARQTQDSVSEINYRKYLHQWICLPDMQVYAHARKVNEQLSDIFYKEDMAWVKGAGCYVWDTPEILRCKHANTLQSEGKYRAKGIEHFKNYTVVLDTPTYETCKQSAVNLSDLHYRQDYDKNVKGTNTAPAVTVDTERAKLANTIQSDILYKEANMKSMPTGYTLPHDTPLISKAKANSIVTSNVKYKEAFELIKAKSYTLDPNGVTFVNIRNANKITNPRLYREQYEKEKDKIHTTHDTPEIRQVKANQEAISDLCYKEKYYNSRGSLISMPITPELMHCYHVNEITSDLKYKEDLKWLKGIGCFLYDTPEIVHIRKITKFRTNYPVEAKKMREKYSVVLDTPEYTRVTELKNHLSELVYRAQGNEQKTKCTTPADSIDIQRVKWAQLLTNKYKYVDLASKERAHYTPELNTPVMEHARHMKVVFSEKKYKDQYEKMKHRYTSIADTPILVRAKKAYLNASDLRYKEIFETSKGRYRTVKDAINIVYHRKVTDDISEVKYREKYISSLGLWRSIPDRPELFHHKMVRDAVSDIKYKEDLDWLKGIGCYVWDTPDLVHAGNNKALYSERLYKSSFEKNRLNFRYTCDTPFFKSAKYASDLINERSYKADYERNKDKYTVVVDDPRNLLAKEVNKMSQIRYKGKAKELLKSGCNELHRPDILGALYNSSMWSKWKYKEKYEREKSKFTSLLETPENETHKRNKKITDIIYKMEYNKNKAKGYTLGHDTPVAQHMRRVKDIISTLKYKETYEREKSHINIAPDAYDIRAAKEAYKNISNLDYKKKYEATKAKWIWTVDRPDFIHAVHTNLQQSDVEYKYDRQALKGCKLSVADDKYTTLAKHTSELTSDVKYKEKYMKARGTYQNKYKEASKKEMQSGSFTTLPQTRDTTHSREITKLVSGKVYKKKFEEEKGKAKYNIMVAPPDVKHAMDVAKNQSNYAYKQEAKAKLHYTPVADRPDIKKATQAAKLISEIGYREKARQEAARGGVIAGRPDITLATKVSKLTSQYKEKFDKEMKGKKPEYDLQKSKIYQTLKDANTLASEIKYKGDLKKIHKPVTDMAESLSMQHGLSTSRLASDYQYKNEFEESKGHYHMVPDTPEQIHLKEASELQSQVKYKEKYQKERGKPMLDFETPTYVTAKEAQHMQSQKVYRRDLEEGVRGKGLTVLEETPELLRAKNATQILNEKEYKKALEYEIKGKGMLALATDTPDFQRARNATDILSQAKYKQTAEMDRSSYTTVIDTPDIIHAQQIRNIISQKKYKEEAERTMCHYVPVLDTPEMQRVRENQRNFSTVLYSDSFRKQVQGKAAFVLDTPEMRRVKETQRIISGVRYHQEFEKSKGSFTPVVMDPITERVKKNMQDFSDISYRGIQRRVVEMERRRTIEHDQETITDLRVWRTNPGSVFDYDPAEDNIQSRSLHMLSVQAQRRSKEHSRSTSAMSIGDEKSEGSENVEHHLSVYSNGFPASSLGYQHAKTVEVQQRSSSVATQQTTVSSIPSHPSTTGKTVRAMYDYIAADQDEVSFKDGDVIVNVQSIDEGWMYGTVQRTGKTGMLPANYVEAI
ncbi:nebulin-like, partial [Scleropages formosus]